jgi:hypothetical protein
MILLNEEQYNIVQKCANDVVFFLEEFGYIQHPKYGRLPLKGKRNYCVTWQMVSR